MISMWDGTLHTARQCIAAGRKLRKNPQRRHIGKMLRDYDGLQVGHCVFVDCDGYNENDCTIERPMTREELDRQAASHSLLTTILPVIGFPRSGVEIIESYAPDDFVPDTDDMRRRVQFGLPLTVDEQR